MVSQRITSITAMTMLAAMLCLSGCGEPEKQPGENRPRVELATVELETRTLELGGGATMELVRAPAGAVRVGAPASEPEREAYEGPARVVRFEKGFWIGRTEVTQAQYQAVMGANPSRFVGPDLPVEWQDSAALLADVERFLAELRRTTGLPVRLPTEAEWEYACRAPAEEDRTGQIPALPAYTYGQSDVYLWQFGWVDESGGRTQPVGTRSPNRWGLLDVHGNVAELTADEFALYPGGEAENPYLGQGYRAVRGGSWATARGACRCAARTFFAPALTVPGSVGLRVVLPIEE